MYLVPVRWCGDVTLQRKPTGSRSVLFSALMSILNRNAHLHPASDPFTCAAAHRS